MAASAALDSFTLLAAIYEIDDRERKRRVAELSELFGLGDFLQSPVRKLSLGQRVRCEGAASLLHEPELLFLDEPTIGLDVVVKHAIRELILRRNRDRGTTVFLTSHDPSDIEQLCSRAVVIDRGAVVLDSPVDRLRREYLGKKLIEVQFSVPQVLPAWTASRAQTESGGLKSTLSVDTGIRPIGDVMERLSRLGNVQDITISNPPMEDIIRAIFQREERE
jgi:ABC-2 type transport system ATP-binding protein